MTYVLTTTRHQQHALGPFFLGSYNLHGTIEGDVIILNSSDMQIHTTVKQAHLGLVTTLVFSRDSRSLLSASFDSTARVTMIEEPKGSGMNLWVIVFIVLLAVLAYYLKANGVV